jgi:GNAT superfamily N-acetyltransferase
MNITQNQYNPTSDYTRVSEFLTRHYQPENRDGNWLEPIWEYMNGHPYLIRSNLPKIGLWENEQEILGVCHFETRMGDAFFQFHPQHHELRDEMLSYAENNLVSVNDAGKKYLWVYVNDFDIPFQEAVKEKGYHRKPEEDRPLYKMDIPNPFPSIPIQDGITIQSIADETNWEKVHRVMWRGFNHEGEPPMTPEALLERQCMFETPKANMNIKIVAVNEQGDFVSICGMFYAETNHFALVEPVATDPDYRRKGIGRATVMEGIRRCAELGATVAYVGSDQLFYQSMGFTFDYNCECWEKIF